MCKCVLYCTVQLPPGVDTIAVDKCMNINIQAISEWKLCIFFLSSAAQRQSWTKR